MKDEIARAKVKAERKIARKTEKRNRKIVANAEHDEERKQHFEKVWREVYGAKKGQTITMLTKSGQRIPITIK